MKSNEDNNSVYKDIFDGMLNMAEFAATRHDDRRTVEFRIFVSYMTPLILAIYYVLKLDPDPFESISGWVIGIGILGYFISIHLVYVLWQVGVAVAMVNDAWRRNLFLAKSECILHHLSKNGETPYYPSDTVIEVNFGYKKKKWTEKELFEKRSPKIILVRNFWELFKHMDQICNDWSRMLVVAVPTMLVIFLALILIFKKTNLLP